jgi:hypothetical protein
MTSHVLASLRLQRRVSSETLLIVAAWAFIAGIGLVQQLPALIANGPTDPDSQMRLVEVRDYLAGSAWTDLRQMRLAPPDGVLMHWSRLVDWPLATLIRISQPALGREMAEVFAISAWPLMLHLVFLFGITAVARRLLGPEGVVPALAFAVFAAPATATFQLGHITHHNAQIALFAVLLALAVRIDRGEIVGVFAGVTAAIMLAIGLETLPLVGIIAAGLSLTWVFLPARIGPGLSAFGMFFGVSMIVQRTFTAAPADWLSTPCDIASLPYVAVAFIGGIGIAGLVRVNSVSMGLRFAGLGVLGLAAAAAIWFANPLCLKGPYAEVDPRIIPLWLENVQEAKSVGQIVAGAPWQLVGLFLAPFLALVPTSWAFACSDRSERAGWGLVLFLLMTAIAVAMWEVRGSTFASVLVVPGMAYTVVELRRWCEARGPVILALGLLLVYIVPNQTAETIAADALALRLSPRPDRSQSPGQDQIAAALDTPAAAYKHCAARGNFARLAVQPTGIVLIESNLGPSVLLDTRHSTLAAPYHRNAGGIIDGFAALDGTTEAAQAVVSRRKVTYVATCPDDPEVGLIREIAPDGFLSRLLRGDLPPWLQPIAIEGPLKLWRVTGPMDSESADTLPTGTTVARSQPVLPQLRGSLAP